MFVIGSNVIAGSSLESLAGPEGYDSLGLSPALQEGQQCLKCVLPNKSYKKKDK